MNKIWFFGDSYADPCEDKTAKSWTKSVTEAFPDYDTSNYAYGGSSLDYLYYTYNKHRKEFQPGDIIIFTITTTGRLFLSSGEEDEPHFMNVTWRTKDNGLEFHVPGDKYYDYFVSDLFNINSVTAILDIFLDFLYYESISRGLKIIGLPITTITFDQEEHFNTRASIDYESKNRGNLQLATGDKGLSQVTNLIRKRYRMEDDSSDWRKFDKTLANHLTPKYNEILANKVIRNIKTNEPIDLGTEWEEI